MKSFNDIKKIIALLTFEIKSLDSKSKYSAIVYLEETIDILKLEALKELPQYEESIKDEDISSDNLVNYEDIIMNNYEEIESNPLDEANDKRIEKHHVGSTCHQELNEERVNTDIKEEPLEDPNPSDTVENDKKKADISEHVCKICQTVFKNRRGLMIHYNIHAGKFKCHICKAPFSAKRELDNHISTCELQHMSCHKLQKIRAYAKLRPRQVPSLNRMERFSSKFKS